MKQVFYTGLRDDLEHFMTSKTLVNLKSEHLPQLWEPHFLEAGTYALTTSKIQNTPALKALLESAHRKEKVLKLCSDKAWSLEQACQGLCMAMENKWIEQPAEPQLLAAVRYMGNRTRLGEYLVEIGRLDKEHLDQALQTQQYMQSALGETMGLGDILIRLQLIGQAEAEAILFLKHESKKPYKMK